MTAGFSDLFDPFEQMQRAVDIVNTSPHPENKIAATLAGTGPDKKFFTLSRTNFWPAAIEQKIGRDQRIGNSSGTIHAETACILAAPRSDGSALFVTDPFCPNCAKNMAEAGVRAIHIDHKGFDKDFAARRGHDFDSMSMRICEKAGISVFEIRRKDRELIPILEVPESYAPVEDSPVEVEEHSSADEDLFRDIIAEKRKIHYGRKLAVALARDHKARPFALTARAHPVIGYSMRRDMDEIEHPQDQKYSFMLEPLNRLLMAAPRHGLKLVNGLVYSSGVPTAREQVNMAGAGLNTLLVGDMLKARDEDAFRAMETMARNGVITFHRL